MATLNISIHVLAPIVVSIFLLADARGSCCVCARAYECVRASVRACMRACVRVCVSQHVCGLCFYARVWVREFHIINRFNLSMIAFEEKWITWRNPAR